MNACRSRGALAARAWGVGVLLTSVLGVAACAQAVEDRAESGIPAPRRLHVRPAGTHVLHAVCDPLPRPIAPGLRYRFRNLDTGAESAWQDSTRWVDMSVKPGETYAYQVQARDDAGRLSASSFPAVGVPYEHPIEGWGIETGTVGGLYHPLVEVTSLDDAGPGTLREALAAGNRYVQFRVGGTIRLAERLRLAIANVTIDGSSAPAPGITIEGPRTRDAIDFDEQWPAVAHDIVVRHVRIQNAAKDNVAIGGKGDRNREAGCYDLIFDHCSFLDGGDGNLDIVHGSHNITVQYCIAGRERRNTKNVLFASSAVDSVWKISFHHNFLQSSERNPQVQGRATCVDVVNNVVSGWDSYGVRFQCRKPGGEPCDPPIHLSGNVVGNVFVPADSSRLERAVQLVGADPTRVFIGGNLIPRESSPLPGRAVARRCPGGEVTESPADPEAVRALLRTVGPRHRNDVEAKWIRATLARLDRMEQDR